MMGPRKPFAFDADETEALQAIGWRQSGGSCPDSALLLAAEEGMPDAGTAARVRAHVAGCATCQMLMNDLVSVLAEDPDEATRARIRARSGASASPSTAGRGARSYIWWGAGLAAVAGLAWFLIVPRSGSLPVPNTQLARVTPTSIPTVFVVDRPLIPPGDVDLTVRGDASTRLSLEQQIGAALDKADKADLAAASADLQVIVQKHKSSRIAALALGAVQLRAGQNADALTTLDHARTLKGDAASADEVGWFLGIALVRTAQPDRARSILADLCKHAGSDRRASACAGVVEIDRNKSAR